MKIKKSAIFAIAAVIVAGAGAFAAVDAAAARKPHDVKFESRPVAVTNFSGVDVSHGIEVTYTPSETVSAEITAPASVMPYVRVDQRGEMLNIFIDNPSGRKLSGNVKVRLTAPVVNTYRLSSGAEVKVRGLLAMGNRDLSVDLSSGAEVSFNRVECRNAAIGISSGAEVDFDKLTCVNLTGNLSSASELDIDGLTVTNLTLEASSASSVELEGAATNVRLTATSASQIDAARLIANTGEINASSASGIKFNITGSTREVSSSDAVITNYAR